MVGSSSDTHQVAVAKDFTGTQLASANVSANTFYAGASRNEIANQFSNRIVIDDRQREIGGDRKDGLKPLMKLAFALQSDQIKGTTIGVTIGQIEGFNTPEAHQLRQNTASHISSPAVIKVNGEKVDYIYTSQKNHTIYIPKYRLNPNGINTLQIQAGYYFKDKNSLAYDQLSIQQISLTY
jgi:hypothetical protein